MSAILHKKIFQELTIDELYELLRVRSEVFVVEQNCVYQDLDYDDQKSIHLWLTVDSTSSPTNIWYNYEEIDFSTSHAGNVDHDIMQQ